ncbi:hypothetical protein [Allokutzneria albata]|uniref:Nuclease-related domain-containing protein n=1 Tax=Allokutzneria albata TaxID=211114 RepID=A0A1G9UL01_ALLAB|nr:hypothetical protein [Allokutzneria albata]SDM60235.1 hypothetical protein SAMN04489726_2459 [Allokutzneria albata]
MLVAVQHSEGARGDGLAGAEAKVAQWMRTWTGDFGLPGIAVFNAATPIGMADALVLSPYGCLVLEIDGFTRRQDGALRAPAEGAWEVDGQPAALHSTNLIEEVRANVTAVRSALNAAGITTGAVPGLVVLLPTPGSEIELASEPSGDIQVVLAPHQKPLRRYFHTLCKSEKVWDANTVAAAARALKLTEQVPGVLDLYQHGIPETIYAAPAAPEAAPPPPPVRQAPPAPAPPPAKRSGSTRLVLMVILGALVLAGLIWLVGTVYDVFH